MEINKFNNLKGGKQEKTFMLGKSRKVAFN